MRKPAWAKDEMGVKILNFENKHWVFEGKFVLAKIFDANYANFH